MLTLTEEQRLISNEVTHICDDFGPEYWRENGRQAEYSTAFLEEVGSHGYLGTAIPEEYGGMDTLEAPLLFEESNARGAGFDPTSIRTRAERYYRKSRLAHIAPGGDEMALHYVGEHVLDLPRSY